MAISGIVPAEALPSIKVTAQGLFGVSGFLEYVLIAAVAMLILRMELQRRAGDGFGYARRGSLGAAFQRLVKQCAPELAGVIACISLALLLRTRGDMTARQGSSAEVEEAYAAIKAEWPILMTADTLLSLQTMFRLVILLSAVFRTGPLATASPLGEEAAALWLLAGIARVALAAKTATYALDGPLGGMVPLACEFASVPLLAALGRSFIRRFPTTWVALLAVGLHFSSRNRLSLGGGTFADSLFIFAHCFDLLSAFAYLLGNCVTDRKGRGGFADGFVHILMLAQTGMSTYYFNTAFDFNEQLVDVGAPFEVLQVGGIIQLGMFLGATALYLAESFDGPEEHDEVDENSVTVQPVF